MTAPSSTGRILVVEDDPVNRAVLRKGVERLGHEALDAADGQQALDLMRSAEPDLVLLDLLMPVLDGFRVLEEMRADPRLDPIPVIVISAVDDTEPVARSIELGAVDCLPKPFEPLLLRVRVDTALRQRRLRQLEQDFLRQEVALRQQDKLATLGRLSAGLAHEINNPIAAALRAVQQLDGHLHDAFDALGTLVDDVVLPTTAAGRAEPVGGGARRRAHLEQALEDVLASHGITEPWVLAGDLAAAGVTQEHVHVVLDGVAPSRAEAAVRLLAARGAVQHTIGHLGTGLQRVADIVGALRSYSYLDRGTHQPVDVHAGLEDTLTILAHKLPDGVAIVRDLTGDLPLVHGSGGQLNQVWTNLVDNAIDAVGDTGRVVVRTRRDGPDVVVEVEDDGRGVPPELLGTIFDPFVTSKEPGQGTGLGLNIAHQIVTEQHGGRLTVESRPGRTVFSVRLPTDTSTQEADE